MMSNENIFFSLEFWFIIIQKSIICFRFNRNRWISYFVSVHKKNSSPPQINWKMAIEYHQKEKIQKMIISGPSHCCWYYRGSVTKVTMRTQCARSCCLFYRWNAKKRNKLSFCQKYQSNCGENLIATSCFSLTTKSYITANTIWDGMWRLAEWIWSVFHVNAIQMPYSRSNFNFFFFTGMQTTGINFEKKTWTPLLDLLNR